MKKLTHAFVDKHFQGEETREKLHRLVDTQNSEEVRANSERTRNILVVWWCYIVVFLLSIFLVGTYLIYKFMPNLFSWEGSLYVAVAQGVILLITYPKKH